MSVRRSITLHYRVQMAEDVVEMLSGALLPYMELNRPNNVQNVHCTMNESFIETYYEGVL